MQKTFEIPESRFTRFSAKVARAASRAPASGLPVPRATKDASFFREFSVADPLARIRGSASDRRIVRIAMASVTLHDFAPEIGEWRVVGYRSAARTKDKTFVAESGEVPAAMRGRELCCDHCGYSRKRKSTFVLRKEATGDTLEVGSGCADAFFGGTGLGERLLEIGELLREIESAAKADLLASGYDAVEEARTVLAFAHRRISESGFLSSSEAEMWGGEATWRLVMDDLAAYRSPGATEGDFRVTAADFVAADDIVASLMLMRGDGGFVSAAKDAAVRGLAGTRDVALLTAAAGRWVSDLKREAENNDARQIAVGSIHVAAPGDRIEFVGRVRRVATFEGEWGPRHYVSITDQDGNVMLWKTGNPRGLSKGRAYELRGTVKEHGTCSKGPFAGAAETVVSRVSVIADLGPFASMQQSAASQLGEEDEEALDSLIEGFPGL